MRAELRSRDIAQEALAEEVARTRDQPLAEITVPRGFGPYRGYHEMLLGLDRLADRGAALEVIGRSVLGRPLFAVRVEPRFEPTVEPCTAVVSGIHPEEWIGIETHLRLLERLLEVRPAREVLAVPLANPDGVVVVEGHLRAGRRRFVRHNARRVDLNRNFPFAWGRGTPLRRLLPGVYGPGTGPASEPEVHALVERFRHRRVDRALSLHSFGGVVLIPCAHRLWPSPRARSTAPGQERSPAGCADIDAYSARGGFPVRRRGVWSSTGSTRSTARSRSSSSARAAASASARQPACSIRSRGSTRPTRRRWRDRWRRRSCRS